MPWGAIAAAGASALGSYLNNKAKSDAYNDSMAFSREQFEYQKALHQNQIQWRVEDAKKAGVHPMAALGLSSMSFSPVSSASAPEYDNWLGDIGQSADYAITKAKDKKQQAEAFALQQKGLSLDLEGKELDNAMKREELEAFRMKLATNQAIGTPAAPGQAMSLIDGQNDSQKVNVVPAEVTASAKTGLEAGVNPEVAYVRKPNGGVRKVMSDAAKERLEEDMLGTIGWNLENRIPSHLLYMFGLNRFTDWDLDNQPPAEYLPKGAKGWIYDGNGGYDPVY